MEKLGLIKSDVIFFQALKYWTPDWVTCLTILKENESFIEFEQARNHFRKGLVKKQ